MTFYQLKMMRYKDLKVFNFLFLILVITIIFGLQLTKSGVKIGASYVVYVYIAVFVVFEVIFEIIKMRERNQVEGNHSSRM